MDISFLLGLVLVFLLLKANKTIAVCQPKRKEFALEFTNKTLVGRLLGSPVAMEEMACQLSCHANDFCDAYNYHTKTRQCELLDGRVSVKLEPANQDWKCRAQKCEKDSCSNGGTCFHFNDRPNCACDPCSWRGEFCEISVTNSDIVMSFPGGSVADLVTLHSPFPTSLSQFTASMWFQIDPTIVGEHAVLSYSTNSLSDVIVVMLNPTATRIAINRKWSLGKFLDPSQLITDNNWQHFLFTWENVNGKLVLYIDGVKRGEKINVEVGQTIDHYNGALVLGQDQDSYLGGYNAQQALKGNLTSLNMWDKVLTAPEISDLASKCPTQEGNILNWSKVMISQRSGNVRMICSPFCVP